MIFRVNQRISNSADEVSFRLSYSSVDVKRWMLQYLTILIRCGVNDLTDSEQSLRTWLQNEPFRSHPSKYAEQLSRWAVATAIRKKILTPSEANPNALIFSDELVQKATNAARG